MTIEVETPSSPRFRYPGESAGLTAALQAVNRRPEQASQLPTPSTL